MSENPQNFQSEFNAENGNSLKFHGTSTHSDGCYSCDEHKNESMPGHTFYYYANAKIQNDLYAVRDCLGERMQTEEHTMDLILEVESMVELMLKEYSKLFDDNRYLNDELRNRNDLVHANGDVNANLRSEHDALIEENRKLKEKNQNLKRENEERIDFDQLQQQLIEKDEEIKELLAKIDQLTIPPAQSPSRECIQSNESPNNESILSISSNTADASGDEIKISVDIKAIFNEKQNQLVEQKAKIDDLIKQFEWEIKEKTDDNKQILAQQLTIYEEQIAVLMDERKKLTQTNNNFMRSISVCQKELCKYDFKKNESA